MTLPHYPFAASSPSLFSFVSRGPRGEVLKRVQFQPLEYGPQGEPLVVNLAFGDVNPRTGQLDNLAVTDNGDRDQVLATVLATVVAFTESYPDSIIFAAGSTPSRTRLYQIGRQKLLADIQTTFELYGLLGQEVLPFEPNQRYTAFLARRKPLPPL